MSEHDGIMEPPSGEVDGERAQRPEDETDTGRFFRRRADNLFKKYGRSVRIDRDKAQQSLNLYLIGKEEVFRFILVRHNIFDLLTDYRLVVGSRRKGRHRSKDISKQIYYEAPTEGDTQKWEVRLDDEDLAGRDLALAIEFADNEESDTDLDNVSITEAEESVKREAQLEREMGVNHMPVGVDKLKEVFSLVEKATVSPVSFRELHDNHLTRVRKNLENSELENRDELTKARDLFSTIVNEVLGTEPARELPTGDTRLDVWVVHSPSSGPEIIMIENMPPIVTQLRFSVVEDNVVSELSILDQSGQVESSPSHSTSSLGVDAVKSIRNFLREPAVADPFDDELFH